MKTRSFKIFSLTVFAVLLLSLTGCGKSETPSSADVIIGVESTGSNTAPTASDFDMTLDINETNVTAEWETASLAQDTDGDILSVSVFTQGAYGNFEINGTTLTYNKTFETNETDVGVIEISDGTDIVQVSVTVYSLYWKQVAAGGYHTTAIKSDGTLWTWGWNLFGQLGDGTNTNSYVPVQEVTKAADWTAVSGGYGHTAAIKSDGTIWSWGHNVYGQLGDGTLTSSNVPVQEDTNATDWKQIAAGAAHTAAIKSDGTLWTWGDNSDGQLGDGTTAKSYVPVQEESNATDWKQVAAGAYHTAAIKSDGTLWTWGDNYFGQLGDGSNTDSYAPVQEDTNATDWKQVAAGDSHTAAIKSIGTLWSWGWNIFGQLGDGTTTNSNVPVQEAFNGANWTSVSGGYGHTAAISSDGMLWSWGQNLEGQLGDGTTTSSNVPEATDETNWKQVATGDYHTAAIKSDGTLWTWGDNRYGQLGDSTTTDSNVPIQIGRMIK